ncbi:SCO2522 family protein [Nocardia wallacei]|uniref:SCO2522 family protein n=1 Tax=Nocardia wallacei TaxID=480035 RepID=UPI002454B668|nr:SCO2522 family protein [Nocardia wallacei]
MQGYSEAAERPPCAPIPLSHLSIEVGHFGPGEILDDIGRVRSELRGLVPLVSAFAESARSRFGAGARVSTCYLIDDCLQPDTDPAQVVGRLLSAAAESGLAIDYLARRSACRRTSRFVDGVPVGAPIPLAEMVAACLVAEPTPPDNGGRPPTARTGWLCNGRRSSEHDAAQAMRGRAYRPPEEFGRREHSVFLDVQLWSTQVVGGATETRWSAPLLSAVWQLLRLGLLRYHGAAVVDPQPWRDESWPRRWHDVPPVVQLAPDAAPFAAYQALSMLPKRYLGEEHAVRLVLDHLDLDDDVVEQTIARGSEEAVPVPRRVSDRLSVLLLDGS